MPYEYDENLDPNSPQNKNPGAPQQIAGSSQVTGSQAPAVQGQAPAGGASAQPTSSGSYQNLQSYLSANDPNAFGQQFAGKVGQDVNQATQVQNQSAQDFKAQSDAGAVKPNQQLVDSAASDPYKFVQDPNNVSQFNAQKNASYSGPTSYQDDQNAYQKAASATTKAENTANAAQSEGGRFALLDNYFGNPNYTQGQKSLDNLLVQNSGDNTQQALAQAKQNADIAQSQFAKQGQDLSNYAAGNRGQTEATANYAYNTINPLLTAEQSGLQGAFTNAQNTGQANYNADLGALSGTDHSKWDPILQSLGANPPGAGFNDVIGGGMDTGYFGLTPTSYLSAPTIASMSNVTALPDQQKLNALQQLMNHPLTQFDATQAGQYNSAHPESFDTTKFHNDLNTAQQNYQNQESGIQNQITQIQHQSVPIMGGSSGDPMAGSNAQIQAQIDQLNQLRSQYGLTPITNPYTNPTPIGGQSMPIL